MPLYEYVCRGCGHEFELLRRISAWSSPAACLRCDSADTRRKPSRFSALGADPGGTSRPLASGCACAAGGGCACARN